LICCGAPKDPALMAKDAGGGEIEGAAHPKNQIGLDLGKISCAQDCICKTLSGGGDGAIEKPINMVDDQLMQARNEKENDGRDGDPGPSRQREDLAQSLANVIDLVMQQ
jgi:hypothetical protein